MNWVVYFNKLLFYSDLKGFFTGNSITEVSMLEEISDNTTIESWGVVAQW